ncbi:MAG: tetratricopeptide repeat protein [Armatimonadetes bacterium]|nr:tetratricopeptide repeat protein [Armatimonadota bacterium]
MPSVWNVPHRRNPHFTGREKLVAQLHAALTSRRSTALVQAIHGPDGVGKTQLAVEHAYRHAGAYDVVWWVRAEEPVVLAADYAGLARELTLPESEAAEQAVIVAAVRRWLEQHTGWLIVFDDVRDPEDLRGYLPDARTGHVIVTSRDPNWRGLAEPVHVPVMIRSEAVEFLLKRTGQTDEAAAAALAGALGDLPLALEQAGAYIAATEGTLAGYLLLFRARREDLLRRGARPPDDPAIVTTTWEIAFRRVEQETPWAAMLLNVCAFLAPDGIPREIFGDAAAQALEGSAAEALGDPVVLDDAVLELRRYSLIAAGETLCAHRLVQAAARDRLPEDERKTWAHVAVRLVNAAFPDDVGDVGQWPACSGLLAHALAALGHVESLVVTADPVGRLLNQVGAYLRSRAEFQAARACFERALHIDEAAYGPDHPNVAAIANNLGRVLQDLGDLAQAKAHLERAVRIDEAVYGPDYPEVAKDLNNLGAVLHDLGNLAEAQACYERALGIFRRSLGEDHPHTQAVREDLDFLRSQTRRA